MKRQDKQIEDCMLIRGYSNLTYRAHGALSRCLLQKRDLRHTDVHSCTELTYVQLGIAQVQVYKNRTQLYQVLRMQSFVFLLRKLDGESHLLCAT